MILRAMRLRVKKIVVVTGIIIVAAISIFTLWLYLWDGGFEVSKQRLILPGIRLNLQTVTTARGLVEYDMYGTEGPVVLSVHAGLGGANQGRLFAGWLQDDGFRILSPGSEAPSRPNFTSGKKVTGWRES